MNNWEILGISPTDDINLIKKAYAEKSKLYHPETHPAEFKQLYSAYKTLSSQYRRKKPPMENLSYVNKTDTKPILPKAVAMETTTLPSPSSSVTVEGQLSAEITKSVIPDFDFLTSVEKFASSNKMANDPLLLQLKEMLDPDHKEYSPQAWRQYFYSHEFLKKQYNPDFLKAFTEIIWEKLLESAETEVTKLRFLPKWLYVYLNIVYGALRHTVTVDVKMEERIYQSELLTDLRKTFNRSLHTYFDCHIIEQRDDLLGERYAFYIYRNILEALSYESPNQIQLKSWLKDAFDLTNTSHVLELVHYDPGYGKRINGVYRYQNRIINSPLIYDLLAYLLFSEHLESVLLEDTMEEALGLYEHQNHFRSEREILKLMIEENREKRKK